MFELEDYTGSFHDGFINKYADSSGPTLDFYISDSLQDMLDVDIRTEIANVVNSGGGGEYGACIEGLQSTFDQATDGTIMQNYSTGSISSSNNNNNNNAKEIVSDSFSSSSNNNNNNNSIYLATSSPSSYGITASTNSSSFWFGSSNDFFADVGACVNPISVMPLISSSLSHHLSSRVNLNRHNSPPPASPSVSDTKSHLTFSPAHIKVSANSIRNEQLTSHIPKQIVAISSALTSATTVPATLATNSLLQRKMVSSNGAESVKKDLGCKLSAMPSLENMSYSTKSLLCTAANAQQVNPSKSAASTIKLGPGIGSLTFAHNITFSKIKQQAYAKSPLSSPIPSSGAGNNGITMNRDRDRDRDRSPSQSRGGAANLPKLVTRHTISSPALGFTPKSIASAAHSILQAQQQSLAAAEGITADRTLADSNGVNNATSNNNIPTTSITTNLISSTSPHGNGNAAHGSAGGGGFGGGLTVKSLQQKIKSAHIESEYPKPAYSYSCLIAMALKNSRRGSLPVSEIYSFMCEHFPYFKTAPSGWKNSVRHNLSLNKCFEKIEKPPTNGYQRKGCLWAMNPERITKMDEEVQKWSRKDPMAIRNAMVYPEHLEALERGEMKHGSTGDSDAELDSQSEIEETSDLEEQDMDETLVEPMLVEDDFDDDEASLLTGGSSGLGGSSSSSSSNGGGAVNSIMLMNSNEGGAEGKSFVARNDSHSLADADTTLTTTPTRAAASHNFDNDVEDIYDAIDIEDDKDAVRVTINHMDIIELNPADYNNVVVAGDENHQSPKRARLNLNCSTIDVSNELEKRFIKQQQQQQQQIHISTVKKIVKINQNVNDLQQQQQQQQSLIVKQSVEASTDVANNTITSLALQQQQQQQFTSVVGLSNITNRRKIQIANRLP